MTENIFCTEKFDKVEIWKTNHQKYLDLSQQKKQCQKQNPNASTITDASQQQHQKSPTKFNNFFDINEKISNNYSIIVKKPQEEKLNITSWPNSAKEILPLEKNKIVEQTVNEAPCENLNIQTSFKDDKNNKEKKFQVSKIENTTISLFFFNLNKSQVIIKKI